MNKKTENITPFIKNIPCGWKLIQNRFLFKEDKKKVGKSFSNYQLLSLTTKGVREKDINTGGKVPESYESYQMVRNGQIVFCLFDLDCSAVFSGISNFDGMITSAYNVYDSTNLISNKFADYWFQYIFTNRYYKIYSKNIRYTITNDMFKSILTLVPPHKTQNLIVAILDKKCSQIDNLITNQQQQIEKLKQYKQSLITEVVTKGLDSNVPMKDSGVEWIGEIPEHWEIRKIKYISTIEKECWSNEYKDIKYIGLENIESGSGKKIETNSIYEKEKAIIYKEKDILFGKLRPYLAKVYLSNEIGCCSSEFCIIRIKNNYILYINKKVLMNSSILFYLPREFI